MLSSFHDLGIAVFNFKGDLDICFPAIAHILLVAQEQTFLNFA